MVAAATLAKRSAVRDSSRALLATGFHGSAPDIRSMTDVLSDVEVVPARAPATPMSGPLPVDERLKGLDLSDLAVQSALQSHPPTMEGAGPELIERSKRVFMPSADEG